MARTFILASFASLLFALPSGANAEAPSKEQLAAALAHDFDPPSASGLRAIQCKDFGLEEPTEFDCIYEQKDRRGAWYAWDVIVAIDGNQWILLDGPSPTSGSKHH